MQEEKIIRDCIIQDRNAQRKLYEQYSGQMYSICLRYCNRADMAADALQEGFINIFRFINTYTGIGNFDAWMRKIIIRAALNQLRKQKAYSTIQENEININENYYIQNIDFDTFSYERMIKHLNNLPDGYRLVFSMYVLDDMNHREISESLKISENTSRSQLFKARKMMQELILSDNLLVKEIKNRI
ncbi:MAG TPA: sigma-70 family RNA polymerase sigma factor [Saprospiraceae bacterium]|nr:sigma-70 family RNA polymerase sigma factor [Lewinellaceae bacterium]HPK09606.1 sigma-70 family RNA polymerase sigma factor [Saprospiraceae bacterium]